MTSENTTLRRMVFNKVTLAFPEKNEILFLNNYFSDSIIQFRIAFFLVTILYAAFGYLDSLMVQEYVKLFHIIRYFIVVPLLLVVLLLSFTIFFRKIWQVLLFISFIVAGAGVSIMTMLAPENYAYYAGMMLIFSAGYFFIKLRFFLASIAGWITLLIFNIGAVFYANAPNNLLITNNFFFISANLIGMFAAYNIEYYARRDFFLNQELDRQKVVVEDANKNLEKNVEERTKELVEAKNKAEQSDLLKSAFLANMSHEIRTPMNGILGFARLLKEPILTSDQLQEYIGIIEQSGERMLNTINDIVDFSKIESGQVNITLSPTNINEQIQNNYNFFKSEAEVKGLKLFFRNGLSRNEAIIDTDTDKLNAILSILIKNALIYCDEGMINLGYEKKGKYIEFFVKDTGIGIPEDKHNAIFERFVQVNDSLSKSYEGAGLGLSIAKGYTEMLGGKIWVESEPNKGSTFYFTIPFSAKKNKKTDV